jgi:geranylgeranyl transferase type-2 subunit beta
MQLNSETQHYLTRLKARLAAGMKFLPDRFRSRHAEYLLAAQRPDGGFAGRLGGSDIYYTMFALRSAELMGLADECLWRRAAQYARSFSAPRDLIACFCLLYIRRLAGERAGTGRDDEGRAGIMEIVGRSRTADGGYARFPGGDATLYHTFLAALCAELSDSDFSGAGEAAAFVHSRRCADGGYADSKRGAQGGGSTLPPELPDKDGGEGATNPTAAALALLTLFGVAQPPSAVAWCGTGASPRGARKRSRVRGTAGGGCATPAAEFFASMQRAEGGFAAGAGAPEADLLSTFTASVALAGIGALSRVKLAPIARFVHALQAREGGFRGCAGDAAPDVEYTYYGLGTLALLAEAAAGLLR